jgi:two-component system sensor histidine kinase BaeS
MLNSLRNRLIISHVLPLLVIVPLTGLILGTLQTRVLLADLSDELVHDAQMAAIVAERDPAIWQGGEGADRFAMQVNGAINADIMIFDAAGHVVATHGITRPIPDLTPLLSGETDFLMYSEGRLGSELADVLVPVRAGGTLVGVIRLTQQFTYIVNEFRNLYLVMSGVLGGGLIMGVIIGWRLAVNLQRPLAGLTTAICEVAEEKRSDRVPVRGPQELRLLAQAFNRLVERLQSLEEARRRLLSNLVHELGRPLGALLSAIEALQKGAADDASLRDELLRGMRNEIGQLRRLLADLSQLSNRTIGPLELNRQPLDLNVWLPAVLASWREAARANGIAWQPDISPDLPALPADADRLAQVLGNLLSNAIKFTPVGGAVRIRAESAPDGVTIRIQDTGPGIPQKEQDRIFDPFHRAQAGHRFPQGMGLGLAIAREIAMAHGGSLSLESSSEEGSTFTLWLPPP